MAQLQRKQIAVIAFGSLLLLAAILFVFLGSIVMGQLPRIRPRPEQAAPANHAQSRPVQPYSQTVQPVDAQPSPSVTSNSGHAQSTTASTHSAAKSDTAKSKSSISGLVHSLGI